MQDVADYYAGKLAEYGASPLGVDWNTRESQELRFAQLLKLCDRSSSFSVNDYGCGYGALAQYMADRGYEFEYRGFDICGEMIAKAKELLPSPADSALFTDESQLTMADYTVASGVFNVKIEAADEVWAEYVLETLDRIAALSRHGFAFNLLSTYSDPERRRPDLYYGDPRLFFDHCNTRFSRFVSLLHDYPLYEFTILVRLQEER